MWLSKFPSLFLVTFSTWGCPMKFQCPKREDLNLDLDVGWLKSDTWRTYFKVCKQTSFRERLSDYQFVSSPSALSTIFWSGYFLIYLICRNKSASFWISIRRNFFMYSYIFNIYIGPWEDVNSGDFYVTIVDQHSYKQI